MGNLAPSQEAAIVRINPQSRVRKMVMLTCGLVPFWAKEANLVGRHSLRAPLVNEYNLIAAPAT